MWKDFLACHYLTTSLFLCTQFTMEKRLRITDSEAEARVDHCRCLCTEYRSWINKTVHWRYRKYRYVWTFYLYSFKSKSIFQVELYAKSSLFISAINSLVIELKIEEFCVRKNIYIASIATWATDLTALAVHLNLDLYQPTAFSQGSIS